MKPTIFVLSQTAALKQNAVGKQSLLQLWASSSHLRNPLSTHTYSCHTFNLNMHWCNKKDCYFFRLKVCLLMLPLPCHPTASCCWCKQAGLHGQTPRQFQSWDWYHAWIIWKLFFLGCGFVVCFVLKAEKCKYINYYTMNDICSTMQMQGGFFNSSKWHFSIVSWIHLLLNFTVYPSAISQSLKLERKGRIFTGIEMLRSCDSRLRADGCNLRHVKQLRDFESFF